MSEPTEVLLKLARIFNTHGIRYLVGGSFASAIYGHPRSTQDVDIVADLSLEKSAALQTALADEFYSDPQSIQNAIRSRSSFNALHLPTMFKADIFILKSDLRSQTEFARARQQEVQTQDDHVVIPFATVEDTLLHKLYWYKLGNQVSDRQWNDVLGMLKIQRLKLDNAYLDTWAPTLGVTDLLNKARQQL